MILYQCLGTFIDAEEDVFEHGCMPDTHYVNYFDSELREFPTLIELKKDLCQRWNLPEDNENWIWFDNRLECQQLENDEGYTLSEFQTERWKKGEIKAWLVTYSFTIRKVNTIECDSLFQDEMETVAREIL